MSLFESAAQSHLQAHGPLPARVRPRTIDDVIGQDHLLGPGRPLRRLVENDRLQSMILWGPPGTGKTSIALAIAGSTAAKFEQVSAVSAGVKEVREVIDGARTRLGTHGQRTILFLDEIHRFTKAQQDALLPAVENGSIILIGATTENPYFQVNSALLSRSVLFRLEALTEEHMSVLVQRACAEIPVRISDEALSEIGRLAGGDGRQALVILEIACSLRTGDSLESADVVKALASSSLRYGVDEHYDVVSAFIKSMRGGDVQATILYLARMIASGEDPRFIARRLVIFASEDIGLADPGAAVQAVTAAHAVEVVGLPEAQLNLAQAAVYLACAPKSNAAAQAIWSARADIEAGLVVEVPAHLRDSHYPGSAQLGHGSAYINPHSGDPRLDQQEYLSGELGARRWYVPTGVGFEEEIRSRMSGDRRTRVDDGEGRQR